MVRLIVMWFKGKTGGVADLAYVRWAEYGDSEEERTRLGVDWLNLGQGLRASGFYSFDRNSLSKGAGADFRMCEAHVVESETGAKVQTGVSL